MKWSVVCIPFLQFLSIFHPKLCLVVNAKFSMKTHKLQTAYLLTLLVALLVFVTSCKTASFETSWSSDTNSWKTYSLNGVIFQIPAELSQMKMSSNAWWYVIKASQADNFGTGVREAVQISYFSKDSLLVQSSENRAVNLIEGDGGRISMVQTPRERHDILCPSWFSTPC